MLATMNPVFLIEYGILVCLLLLMGYLAYRKNGSALAKWAPCIALLGIGLVGTLVSTSLLLVLIFIPFLQVGLWGAVLIALAEAVRKKSWFYLMLFLVLLVAVLWLRTTA